MPSTKVKPKKGGKVAKTSGIKIKTTLAIIVTAIQDMKEKKGSSAQAITKYILTHNKKITPSRLKVRMKAAIKKGLETGVLKRPKSSEHARGTTGRFKVGTTPKSPLKRKRKTKKRPKKKRLKKAKIKIRSPKKIKPSRKPRKTIRLRKNCKMISSKTKEEIF